ncbi:uncharacterized protein uri [Epargyreus clarus]|uniref:uncharacterized protein uri n=1 Tax=Epargyreus clarus TaxID=520877 RepID=UPI003C2D126E
MAVNLLHNIYQKNLFENEKNITFWEDYLQNLNMLDFNVFSEKLSVPVLVPVGSRMFFRGQLKHTNEITVALGADYFAKCSVNQAQILREHRIKDAKSKLELLKKERDFLKEQLSFSKQNVFDEPGHDIIEVHTEEEDKAWRAQHRDRVRQYKQNKDKSKELPTVEITDEELWNRLDELELQEELENEMSNNEYKKETVKEVDNIDKDIVNMPLLGNINDEDSDDDEEYVGSDTESKVEKEKYTDIKSEEDTVSQSTNLYSLKELQERDNVEHQNKYKTQSEKEAELLAKLDEMEKREEIEDEIYRKDGMMQSDYSTDVSDEYGEDAEDEETDEDIKLKKKVSFADENDSETLELTFKHSDIDPINIPYDKNKGITKPSDIYEAFPSLFCGETSILKKTKYDSPPDKYKSSSTEEEHSNNQVEVKEDLHINRTILIKDVTEKVDHIDNDLCNKARPMSLFKKRRQQQQ